MSEDDVLRERIRAALDTVQRPAPGLLARTMQAVQRRPRRRVGAAFAWALVCVLVAGAALGVLMQHERSRSRAPAVSPTPHAQPAVYTLTAANTVLAFDASLHRLWQRQVLPAPSGNDFNVGSAMRLSPDRSVLYVVPLVDDRGGTEIRSLDARTGEPRGAVVLSRGEARYRALAVGRDGEVYAVGQDGDRILVSVVDPARGVVITTRATRTLPATPSLGEDLPYEAELSGGGRLYYSFGGPDQDRAGIDWVDVAGSTLTPCRAASPTAPCIPGPAHGFDVSTGHLLAVDSGSTARVVDRTLDGAELRRIDSGLAAGAQDLVVADSGRTVVMLGSCAGSGGLVRIDLGSGRARPVATPLPPAAQPQSTVCGLRPALLTDGSLIAAAILGQGANLNGPGSVEVIDPQSGRVLRQAQTGADPVDVIAAA